MFLLFNNDMNKMTKKNPLHIDAKIKNYKSYRLKSNCEVFASKVKSWFNICMVEIEQEIEMNFGEWLCATALMAAIGLLPAAVSTGIGSESQKPLAVVIIGGLVTATLFILLVFPIIYYLHLGPSNQAARLYLIPLVTGFA
mgnify:CR=1 FL=1